MNLFENARRILGESVEEEKIVEAVSKDEKTKKLEFLKSRLASESGDDAKETQKEIDELSKDSISEGVDEIKELKTFIDNEESLNSQKETMYKNLSNKKLKGVYDKELASKLLMYLVDSGSKLYAKKFSSKDALGSEIFSKEDRKNVAKQMVDDFEDAFENKEYEFMKSKDEKKVVKEGAEEKTDEKILSDLDNALNYMLDKDVKTAFKLPPELKKKIEELFGKIDSKKVD
jgi:hypothetical protein